MRQRAWMRGRQRNEQPPARARGRVQKLPGAESDTNSFEFPAIDSILFNRWTATRPMFHWLPQHEMHLNCLKGQTFLIAQSRIDRTETYCQPIRPFVRRRRRSGPLDVLEITWIDLQLNSLPLCVGDFTLLSRMNTKQQNQHFIRSQGLME